MTDQKDLALKAVIAGAGLVVSSVGIWLGSTVSDLASTTERLKVLISAQSQTTERLERGLDVLQDRVGEIRTEQARRTGNVYKVNGLTERIRAQQHLIESLTERIKRLEKKGD